ncbi:hypothetical protein QJS10_CPB22g01216 [Acorus calamus]|uniref:DUF7755 domain-containing protein n=1 Tax=Acorus calamus TaxID=4465 RepID=A0AAV9C1H6_ACOCL|nr:hypothetical protein QJS10_CPB22g01216 [Acorus calamus]
MLTLCFIRESRFKKPHYQTARSSLTSTQLFCSSPASSSPFHKVQREMEVLSVKHTTSSLQLGKIWSLDKRLFGGVLRVPSKERVSSQHILKLHSVPLSKELALQDFQNFGRPSRLLPATDIMIYKESWEDLPLTVEVDKSCSFFMVQLCTSSDFGSSLSNSNSAILLCLIDTNGDSILQRIPSMSVQHVVKAGMVASEQIHFQRGSVDMVTFKGPQLAKIEALWIGVESGAAKWLRVERTKVDFSFVILRPGSWRLGGVNLTIISGAESSISSKNGEEKLYSGWRYDFEQGDVQIGEDMGASMVILKPSFVTELAGIDFSTLLNMNLLQSSMPLGLKTSNETSMKEYSNLKLSLLIYDVALVFAGTSIAAFTIGDDTAFAFFIGGMFGFLYLLSLQRSVDGLSASTSSENLSQLIGGFKGPLTNLALILASFIIAVKYGFGSEFVVLKPLDLLVGVAGFLSCKVAVVMAAFKPMQIGTEENK